MAARRKPVSSSARRGRPKSRPPATMAALIVRRAGSLHPGKYVRELARVAAASGASLHGGVTVQGYGREGGRFRVQTSAGTMTADALMVATNGYTGAVTPWQQRRLVPVASYNDRDRTARRGARACVAAEAACLGDTKKVLYYFRPSPDGERILVRRAVRVSWTATCAVQGRGCTASWCICCRGLAGVRITHAWKGNVAFAFDFLPHVGQQDGVHYALACNGSGVVTMTHLGRQAARQIIGGDNRPSAFSRLPFPTMRGLSWHPLVHADRRWLLSPSRTGWTDGRSQVGCDTPLLRAHPSSIRGGSA